MRKMLLPLLLGCSAAFAQTEADINSYTEAGLAAVKEGRLSPGDFYRELHRRIRITPSSEYPWKAENLKIVGQRIDIYEAMEAGQISPEKAERLVAEQQAQWDAEIQARRRAEADAAVRQRQQAMERQQEAEARDEAARRAMALQLLQGQMNRPAYQAQPYQMPRATNCSSQWVGNSWQTVCR